MAEATVAGGGQDRRRWVLLWVIGLAQLMVVLDLTVMNIALPSAQRALHFSTVDRQWVVTAYTLSFGSLLLLGGKLSDLLGRKVTFLTGLAGFAGVSAIGGASVNFAMLITARACQGAFAGLLGPAARSLLTTTFTDPKERNTAFGIFGAIAGAGGAVGLLLGGLLTEYLSWRWTLYVNLIFAGVAFTGGALLLGRQPSPARPRLDIPGVLLVSGALFCLVYGFSSAALHGWHAPSCWGFLVASDWFSPRDWPAAECEASIEARLGARWLRHMTGDFFQACATHCKETQFLLSLDGPILEDGIPFVPPPDIEPELVEFPISPDA